MKRSSLLVTSLLILGLLFIGALAGCGGEATTTTLAAQPATTTGAVATTTTAGAPTTTLSAGDTGVDYPNIIYNTFKGLGKGQLDVEAWKVTEAAAKSVEYQRNAFLFKNEMDPAVIAYWEALGMKKEMHDADDPALKWASYTPLRALAADNTAVYPVVFDFVGAEQRIISAEGHGIAYVGAKEGYIAILPSNPVSMAAAGEPTNLTPGEQVVRILDALEAQGYPIDRSRVYVTGMSMGGVATAMVGLEIPGVVAGCAMLSGIMGLNTEEDGEFVTPASDYVKAMDYDVPLLVMGGDHDFGGLPIKTEGIMGGLNLWLQVNDCPTQLTFAESQEAQATSTDEAVKAIGLVGDHMWTETIDGVVHYGAEFYRADGVKMVELVCVTNLPHWPSGTFAELAWEFLSMFSKDADGNLIVAR